MDDQRGPIDGDGGRPHPSDMERRVAALETDMSEIKSDLKRLISDVAEIKRDMLGMKLDVAEIKGRLSQTPTTIQLISLVFGIMAASFAVLKFTGHP
ncbi:MAG: hypothetical protein AB7H71_01475 [Alphaproteobacteria bacterium]